jgi:hypothetical protein
MLFLSGLGNLGEEYRHIDTHTDHPSYMLYSATKPATVDLYQNVARGTFGTYSSKTTSHKDWKKHAAGKRGGEN